MCVCSNMLIIYGDKLFCKVPESCHHMSTVVFVCICVYLYFVTKNEVGQMKQNVKT